jgi:hypothetical protein
MTEQGLAVYGQFDTMQRAALALHESGFFKDSVNKAQAIVKVMAGAELGLPPFASMSGIHIVQGKPVLGANVIATLVKNDPRYNYKIVECTDKICTIEWFENGRSTGQSSFTMSEAQNAGLTGKDNWKKYPSDMLFARAISRGARRHAPGIFGGSPVYTPDELNVDTDEEGYINGEHTVVEDELPTPSNNGHNLVDEAVDMGGVVKSSMSLETAENVTNSKGEKYGELDTELLSNMANSIAKAMKKNGMSHEKHEEHQMKLDAIKVILENRNG